MESIFKRISLKNYHSHSLCKESRQGQEEIRRKEEIRTSTANYLLTLLLLLMQALQSQLKHQRVAKKLTNLLQYTGPDKDEDVHNDTYVDKPK